MMMIEPITMSIIGAIVSALIAAAGSTAAAVSASQAANAQAANQQRNQASVVDQYRRSVVEATKRKAQEDAKFAEQRDAEQRNKMQALGILENRAGASGQIGNSVDASLGDLYASIARQENIGNYNEKILQQNTEGEFRELGNSFTSTFNSAGSVLQKPSFLGQALEVGGATIQGGLAGYQLGSGIDSANAARKATEANNAYLVNQGLGKSLNTFKGMYNNRP
jgi:hypothetical protein